MKKENAAAKAKKKENKMEVDDDDNNSTVGCNNLVDLPREIVCGIGREWLDSTGVVSLSQTCHKLHTILGLASMHYHIPGKFDWVGDYARGDWCNHGFRLPSLVGSPRSCHMIHSYALDLRWKDQGWGNKKGRFFIVGRDRINSNVSKTSSSPQEEDHPDFCAGGRVVYKSPVAEHVETGLRIRFRPRMDETYHLWYICGGGGGHTLSLRRMFLRALVFDDERRNYSRNFQKLSEAGILWSADGSYVYGDTQNSDRRLIQTAASEFYPKMLLHVARELLSQMIENPDVDMRSNNRGDFGLIRLLHDYDIPINRGSLEALEGIAQAQIEECRMYQAEQSQNPRVMVTHETDSDDDD
jgi:hypothetical protein